MRTSTKIFIGIFFISLIGAIFTARFLFSAINIVDGTIFLNMTFMAWVGVVFNVLNIISGNILFIRFLKTRKLNTMLFFSTVPLGLAFATVAFVLSGINNFSGQTFNIVKTALNINVANNNNYMWLGVVAIVYVLLMFFTFTVVTMPLKKVQNATKRLAYGEVSNKIDIGGNKQFLEIESSLNKINQNYKQKDVMVGQNGVNFEKIVPKQLIKYLGKKNIKQFEYGETIKKKVTIFCCNICNSAFEDKLLDLQDNFKYIDSYLKIVCPVVKKNGGFIDKFFDDGLIAVFVDAQSAVKCALNIVTLLSQNNLSSLDLGICLHTTEVGFGVIASKGKKVLTINSDCKLIYDKLNNFNKSFGSVFVFTRETLNNLPSLFKINYRFVGNDNINGASTAVFECLDAYSKQKKERLNKCSLQFESGVRSFINGKFVEAKNIFEKVYKAEKNDKVCYAYYNKCCENLGKIVSYIDE